MRYLSIFSVLPTKDGGRHADQAERSNSILGIFSSLNPAVIQPFLRGNHYYGNHDYIKP